MIVETKRLWLQKAVVFLDDDAFLRMIKAGRHASVTGISYTKHVMPHVYVRTKTTACIDLTLSEEDVFARMSATTRNEIRRTYTNESLVFSGPEACSDEIYQLYAVFERGQHRVPMQRDEADQFQYFVARYEGEVVSSISVAQSAPYLRIRSIFSKRLDSDKEMKKIISNATRRVLWDICRWGKHHEYVSLDLASVNFENPKTKSITDFKMSFGGDVVTEYTHIYKSVSFTCMETIFVIYRRLSSIFRGSMI